MNAKESDPMTPTLSPLTVAFITAIRELHALGPDGDGRGFEAKLSHARDCVEEASYELYQLEKMYGDPYLYDLIPGAAAERERALRGE